MAKKSLCPKNVWVKKNLELEKKSLSKKNLGQKPIFGKKKKIAPKQFCVQNIWVQKIFLAETNFLFKKFLVQQKSLTKKICFQPLICRKVANSSLAFVDWVSKECFQSLIPLKVANSSLALQIGTIPVWVGSVWSNSDYKAISASQLSLSLGLAELGNK